VNFPSNMISQGKLSPPEAILQPEAILALANLQEDAVSFNSSRLERPSLAIFTLNIPICWLVKYRKIKMSQENIFTATMASGGEGTGSVGIRGGARGVCSPMCSRIFATSS